MGTSDAAHTGVLSDEEIIELFRKREESAIRETDTKYGNMLYRIAYQILKDRNDCEECLNDTYLAVWSCIPPTRPKVFSAFISKIMRNTAIDRYKKRMSQKRVPSEMTLSMEELADVLASDASPDRDLAAQELGRAINTYVRGMTERERHIFIERFYLAETFEHIAGELHISTASVHRTVEHIKRGLKLYLERKGVIT